MSLNSYTQPAAEPLTVAEAKDHLRVTDSASDPYVEGLIAAARLWCEAVTGNIFVSRTMRWTLDRFPEDSNTALILPAVPVRSISSITYLDGQGDSQTWNNTLYLLTPDSMFPRLTPISSESWPDTFDQAGAVTIDFIAGYASDGLSPEDHAANVPEDIKHALRLLIGHWYENRIATAREAYHEIPLAVNALLGPYKIRKF